MKKTILYILLMIYATGGFGQTDTIKPGYQRYPGLPPFTLLQTDKTDFTRDDLKKHKKTLILFFSPTCDHCKHQIDSMLVYINKFKDIQIIMATYQPFEEMVEFFNHYKLSNYPGIKVGRDTKYFFPPFYRMGSLPFLILYNEKGNLITTFEGTTQIDKVLQAFKGKGVQSRKLNA